MAKILYITDCASLDDRKNDVQPYNWRFLMLPRDDHRGRRNKKGYFISFFPAYRQGELTISSSFCNILMMQIKYHIFIRATSQQLVYNKYIQTIYLLFYSVIFTKYKKSINSKYI